MSATTYAVGVVHLSICAPIGWEKEAVERFADRDQPSGVGRWKVIDPEFATGQPNPCACNDEMSPSRRHWLVTVEPLRSNLESLLGAD